MRQPGCFAASAVVMVCVAAAPTHLGGAVSNAYAQNGTLASYTFQIHGVMVMRGFPWLHFRIAGTGSYVRGVSYTVNLTHLPFFAKAFGHVDLSALAPSMWPLHYTASYAGQDGNEDLYRLADGKDKNLRDALVRVDPSRGITQIELSYDNGSTVDLFVNCGRSSGYLLPNSARGQIGAPIGKLAVTATFGDYAISEGKNVRGDTAGSK